MAKTDWSQFAPVDEKPATDWSFFSSESDAPADPAVDQAVITSARAWRGAGAGRGSTPDPRRLDVISSTAELEAAGDPRAGTSKIADHLGIPFDVVNGAIEKARAGTIDFVAKNPGARDKAQLLFQSRVNIEIPDAALRHQLDTAGVADTLKGLKATDFGNWMGMGAASLSSGAGELFGSKTLVDAGKSANDYYAKDLSNAATNPLSMTAGVIGTTMQSAPGMVLGMGSGAILAKGAAAALPSAGLIASKAPRVAGLLGGEASVSALSGAGEAAHEFDIAVKANPGAVLESPRYKELLAQTGDQKAALSRLRSEAVNRGAAGQAAGTAIGSAIFPGLDGRVIGKVLGQRAEVAAGGSIAKRGGAVVGETLQEGVQGGLEKIGGNLAEASTFNPNQNATEGALLNASMSAISGMATSGAVEGVSLAKKSISFADPNGPASQAGITPVVIPTSENVSTPSNPGGVAPTPNAGGSNLIPPSVGTPGYDAGIQGRPGDIPAVASSSDIGSTPVLRNTSEPASSVNPIQRTSDADLLGRVPVEPETPAATEAGFAAQDSATPQVAVQGAPTAPAEPSAAAVEAKAPDTIWTGRSGSGYETQQQAENILPMREKADPGFTWNVEQRPDGKFQLAGYATANYTFKPLETSDGSSESMRNPAPVEATESAGQGQPEGDVGAGVPAVQVGRDNQPLSGVQQQVSAVPDSRAVQGLPGEASYQSDLAQGQAAVDASATRAKQVGAWHPTIKMEAADPQSNNTVREMSGMLRDVFGVSADIVPFSDPGKDSVNGLQLGSKVYVNTSNADLGVNRTGAHETHHVLQSIAEADDGQEKQNPKGWVKTPAQNYRDKVDAIFDTMSDAGKRTYISEFLSPEAFRKLDPQQRETLMQEKLKDPATRKEMMADFVGNRFDDDKFVEALAKADPSGFQKFADAWTKFVKDLVQQLKGTGKNTHSKQVDSYVADLEKSAKVVQDALIKLRKDGGPAGRATGQEINLSQKNNSSTSGLDAILDGNGEANDKRFERARDGGGRREARGSEDRKVQAPERGVQKNEPLPGAPRINGTTGPDPRLVSVAESYAKENGIKLTRQSAYAEIDEDRARRIADAYEGMAHDPQNPAVKEAYENLIRQTTKQYHALTRAGYKFWFIDPGNPANAEYLRSPRNAMRDIRANKEMGVFPTSNGFGSGDFDPNQSPMLRETGIRWPSGGLNEPLKPVMANDLFRAVHDAFGHGLEGAGFRAQGEENAWQAHVRLFTGSAIAAITGETRGQNSWLNYGPHGEANRTASVADTIFGDQKVGLMPEWTWTEGRVGDASFSRRFKPVEEFNGTQELGSNDGLGNFNLDNFDLEPSPVSFPDLSDAGAKMDRMAQKQDELQAELDAASSESASIDAVGLKQMEAQGVYAERAFEFGEAEEKDGFIEIKDAANYDEAARYEIEEMANGWSASTRTTFHGSNAPRWTKEGAVRQFKNMVAAPVISKSGFDLISAYRKGTSLKLAQTWRGLAGKQGAFKLPGKSKSLSFKQVADEIGAIKDYDIAAEGDSRFQTMTFADRKTGEQFEASLSVFGGVLQCCTIGLAGSKVGSDFYAVASEWARNKGLSFRADPILSVINTYRRTEQAVSYALKTGDTGVTLPGWQNRVYGYNEKPKTKEDHDMNIARLLLAGMRNVLEIDPEMQRLRYDPESGKFTDSKGADAEAQAGEFLKNKDARAAGMGRSTLARAVLTNQIIKGGFDAGAVKSFAEPVAYSRKIGLDEPLSEGYGNEPGAFSRKVELSPKFAAWFGGSKAVDASRNPLVLYHGTNARNITVFNTEDFGALLGKGAYFTTDPKEADDYSGNKSSTAGANTMPVFLSIKNPYEAKSTTEKIPKRGDLSERGFDGVLLKNKDGFVRWAVAFDPAQIKSVFNNGDFNPADDRISYSRSTAQPPTEQLEKWAKERRARDTSQAQESEKDRQYLAKAKDADYRALNNSSFGKLFDEAERQEIESYLAAGDRRGANKEGLNAAVSVIGRSLKEEGVSIDRMSISAEGKGRSIYARVGDEVVRISDHDLPLTPEREYNRSIGLSGKWDREVIVSNWKTKTIEEYLAEIKSPDVSYSRKAADGYGENIPVDSKIEQWAEGVFKRGAKPGDGIVISKSLPHDAMTMSPGMDSFGKNQPVIIEAHALNHASKHAEDGLTAKMIGQLPDALKNPRMLAFQAPGQMLVMLPLRSENGAPVVISLKKEKLDSGGGRVKVTRFATAYPMTNSAAYIVREIKKGSRIWMPLEEVSRLQDLLAGVNSPSTQQAGSSQTQAPSITGGSKPTVKNFSVLSNAALVKQQAGGKDWAEAGEQLAIKDGAENQLQGIDFSRKSPTGLPEETRLQGVQRIMQDQYNRVKLVQDIVAEEGGVVGDEQDVYRAEERMHGRVHELMRQFKDDVMQPFLDKAVKAKIDLNEVALYAYAKHAKERNAHIQEINSHVKTGSGMSDAEADSIIQLADLSGDKAAFEDLHNDLLAMTATTRRVMLDEGLITQGQYDSLEEMYENYVPLRGFEDVETETGKVRPGLGRGFNVKGEETIKAMGRDSKAGDIIENIVRDYERATIRSEKNAVFKTFLDLVTSNPDPKLWNVKPIRRATKMVDGLVEYQNVEDKGDDTVAGKVAGENVYIGVNDPLLLRAMQNTFKGEKSDAERFVMRVAGAYTSFLRNTITRYNPVFGFINAVRDAQMGAAGIYDELGSKGLMLYTKRYFPALMAGGRIEVGMSNPQKNKMDQWMREMRFAGGTTGGVYMRDNETIRGELRDAMLAAGVAPNGVLDWAKHNTGTRAAKHVLHALEMVGATSEHAARLSAYVTAREMGKTPAQAASIAKNLTVNFNRFGEQGQLINTIFMFYNASVQGSVRISQMARNPKVLAGFAGMAGVGLAVALSGASNGGDDDDGQAYWDKIPDFEKERNLIVMLPPGSEQGAKVGKHGRYIKIPMPYGLNIFPVLGYQIADLARHTKDPARGVGAAKAAVNMVSAVMGSYNPFGGAISATPDATWALAVAPTIVDPIIQLSQGVNGFGKPVGPPKSEYDKRPDSEIVSGARHGKVEHRIARYLNDATGGNPGREGFLDFQPGTIGNLGGILGGGTGRFISDVINLGYLGIQDQPIERRDIPIYKAFYGEYDSKAGLGLYYERSKSAMKQFEAMKLEQSIGVKRSKATQKEYDAMPSEEKAKLERPYTDEEKFLQRMGGQAQDMSKALSEMKKWEVSIAESKSPDKEKELKRREIQKQREKMAVQYNKDWYGRESALKRAP